MLVWCIIYQINFWLSRIRTVAGFGMSKQFLEVTYKNNCWVWHVGTTFECHI